MAPLWVSSYVLQLRVPAVSLTVENIADFISAYIIGNLLQMAFRFWAFRRWVFPDEFARNPDKALESALTAGGYRRGLRGRARGRQRDPVARLAQQEEPVGSARRLLGTEGVENLVIQQRVHFAQARNVVELQRIL